MVALAIPGHRVVTLGGMQYAQRVLATRRANLIGYWPLDDTSGAVCRELSGVAGAGAYTGVDLAQPGIGDGRTSPLFDGANDFGNIYTAALAAAFNKDEGTLMCWAKVAAAGVWTDGSNRRCVHIEADGNNRVVLGKLNPSQWYLEYGAGGTTSYVAVATSAVSWLSLAITWSVSADQVIAYVGGAQVGTTKTGLGTWVGALSPTANCIGAASTTPTFVFSGNLAHVALWSTPLTPAEIARLARV